MSVIDSKGSLKIAIILVLCVVALGLFVVDKVMEAKIPGAPDLAKWNEADNAVIGTLVDSLLFRYQIESSWIRKWQVQISGTRFYRIEQRVFVPPTFISVSFNYDLNQVMSRIGARAIATERLKENTVIMHIEKHGIIVHSISFVMNPDL